MTLIGGLRIGSNAFGDALSSSSLDLAKRLLSTFDGGPANGHTDWFGLLSGLADIKSESPVFGRAVETDLMGLLGPVRGGEMLRMTENFIQQSGGKTEITAPGTNRTIVLDPQGKGAMSDTLLYNLDTPQLLDALVKSEGAENLAARVVAEAGDGSAGKERLQRLINGLGDIKATEQGFNHLDDFRTELAARSQGLVPGYFDLANPRNHERYVVQPNDNLSKIAARFEYVDARQIAALNGLKDPTQLMPGQQLILPTQAYLTRSAEARDYFSLLVGYIERNNGAMPPISSEFGRFGSLAALQKAAGEHYAKLVDEGYERGKHAWDAGRLDDKNMNRAIGNFMDIHARLGMKRWLFDNGVREGIGDAAQVYVNRRLYDEERVKFRIPDVRIGDVYFDASLQTKTENTKQIQDFWKFGNPSRVIIYQPTTMGGPYDIPRPNR